MIAGLLSDHADTLTNVASLDNFVHHGNGIVRIADDALSPVIQSKFLSAEQIAACSFSVRLKIARRADKCPCDIFIM